MPTKQKPAGNKPATKATTAKKTAKPAVVANKLVERGFAVINPANENKPITSKMQAAHAIQAVINAGPITVAALAKRVASLGISEARVLSHVTFERDKRERITVSGRDQKITLKNAPNWRTAGSDGLAKKLPKAE